MAVEIRTYRIDDVKLAEDPVNEVPATQTIRLAVNGREWDIDMGDETLSGFLDAVAPYQRAGRRVARRTRPRSKQDRQRSSEIRQWARARGRRVSDRGRIPGPVVAEFEAENPAREPAPVA